LCFYAIDEGNSIWAFMLLTSSRQEYLLRLEDLSKEHHTTQFLANVIEETINQIGTKKFVGRRMFLTALK